MVELKEYYGGKGKIVEMDREGGNERVMSQVMVVMERLSGWRGKMLVREKGKVVAVVGYWMLPWDTVRWLQWWAQVLLLKREKQWQWMISISP